MSSKGLPEFADFNVWEVAARDEETDEESTAWRATIDGDEEIPTFGGDTATEAVDVLLQHLRGDDHVSPFIDDTDESEITAGAAVDIPDDTTINEFVDLAEELSRGHGILDDPQDVDLDLVRISASFTDPDGILRTYSVEAEEYDATQYADPPTDDDEGGDQA